MRRYVKIAATGFIVGALFLGAAWAGGGLIPIDLSGGQEQAGDVQSGELEERLATAAESLPGEATEGEGATFELQPGQVLAGASKVSMEPRPVAYEGVWETEGCATMDEDAPPDASHVADFRVRWPEKPNCLYMGGYGIGPMNPITKWTDPYGLWIRSLAIGDGSDTLVLTIVDGVYYFGDYANMCDGCGFFDLAAELGAELQIDPDGFIFASTHSHTSPDFIGGWGGVPDWYFRQVADAIRQSVTEAVDSMRPGVIEMGEAFARPFNSERRDFYHSAEDNALSWFRVIDATQAASPQPVAIATVGGYSAHPVTADESTGIADADFPGVFNARVEERFGGTGLFFQAGFGNVSPRGNKVELGGGLANLIPEPGLGTVIENPDVRSAQAFWDQPVTNSGLTALGVPGFFDRPFAQKPSSVSTGENANKPCTSASAVTVTTAVSAAKIGPLVITGAPGEIFSNYSNTIEEKNPNGITMALSLVNDGLGYIMQSFETDHAGRQVLGFVGEVVEYEDAYSIDHCFGDMALETTLTLLGGL
ncbi:MAG: hypothetical protein ACRDHM_04045 [Actinomycetota bacterium]